MSKEKYKCGDKVQYKGENLYIGGIGFVEGKAEYNLVERLGDTRSKYRAVPARQLKRVKTYAVDIHWTVARVVEVEATSRADAEKQVQKTIDAGEVCVWTDGFETTDEVEVACNGEENAQGEVEYD